MAGLSPTVFQAFGKSALPQAGKPPKPPKPPSVGRAGGAVLAAGQLSQPSVGSAGSALLGGANNLTKPQAAGAPSNPPPSVTAPPATGSPLDSTYYQNVAQNLYRVNGQVNALNLQQSQNQTALQTALAALAYQQPRDQLALEQRANQGGGLYSSVENMNQGNLVHSYETRQTADQSNYNNAASRIAAQIAALQGGIPIFDQGEALASGQRAAAAAQNNPALTAPPAPPVPAAAGGGGKGGKGKGVGTAGSALLGAFGALTGSRAGIATAGSALNRQKLTNALAKGKRR